MILDKASLSLSLSLSKNCKYDSNCSFIILATVITIVNYDHRIYIVQATGHDIMFICEKYKVNKTDQPIFGIFTSMKQVLEWKLLPGTIN